MGKYKELITDKRKNGFAYGRGEKYDLTLANDINSCLSSELALLGTPETEILFMRKYEQKRLAQYRKRTEIIKGKGDMIVLVDESSSTREVQAWAKAFALAMLDIAARDNRKFAMVHFASAKNVRTDLFEPGHYTSADVISAAEQFFGGGTNFEAPLTEAINLMENGYVNSDITIITDGECRISDEFAERFRNTMMKYKASVTIPRLYTYSFFFRGDITVCKKSLLFFNCSLDKSMANLFLISNNSDVCSIANAQIFSIFNSSALQNKLLT